MKKVLFFCPQMEHLARAIVRQAADSIELGYISWENFADGWPHPKIIRADTLRTRDVVFLASFQPNDLFAQLSVMYQLPDYYRSLKIVLPFFPTGTMERIEVEGEVPTALTLARMLSAIPGRSDLIVYDIHDLRERHYFGDHIVVRPTSGIPLLKARIQPADYSIVFPDEGARKRFGRFFPEYDQIICYKVRNGNERIVSIIEGDPNGKAVLIVDDLIQTGGTLRECKDALLARGAASVSAYCTHGVFPNNAWQQFTGAGFKKIFITDSCPQSANAVRKLTPFTVLSLAENIATILTNE